MGSPQKQARHELRNDGPSVEVCIDSAIRLFLLLSGQTITSDFFPPFVPSQILLSARYFGQSWRAATRLPVCWRPQRHRRDRLYGRLKITTLYSNNNPFFCSSSSLKKKFETDAVRTRSLRRKRQQQTTLKRKHLFPPPFFPLSLYPPFQVPFDRFTCHASSTLSISIQKTVLRILNQSFPTNTCFANIFSPVTFSMSTLFGNEHLRFCRNLNCDDCCLMKR